MNNFYNFLKIRYLEHKISKTKLIVFAEKVLSDEERQQLFEELDIQE